MRHSPKELGIKGNRAVLGELDREIDAWWFRARTGKITSQGKSGSNTKP